MPFDLPLNFQPYIQAGLDEENLTGKARAKFITSIAEAIYRFKSYPTKEEYEHVANRVVKKWGFLETKTGHVSYLGYPPPHLPPHPRGVQGIPSLWLSF